MIDTSVQNGVARIVLSGAPVNAMAPALVHGIDAALDMLSARDDWQVLAFESRLRVFCAGGDLATMLSWMDHPGGGAAVGSYSFEVQQLCRRIAAVPQVTFAACGGAAVGGGLELALACDLRAASSGARFGLPEVSLGLLPAAGGTQRLTRLCGKGTAARLIFASELVDAAEALRLGLVQWVFPSADFAARCNDLLARMAGLPWEALLRAKECIGLALTDSGESGFELEIAAATAAGGSPDTRALVMGFLDGKRLSPPPEAVPGERA